MSDKYTSDFYNIYDVGQITKERIFQEAGPKLTYTTIPAVTTITGTGTATWTDTTAANYLNTIKI